jgi:hypothetical protein
MELVGAEVLRAVADVGAIDTVGTALTAREGVLEGDALLVGLAEGR